MERLRLGCEPYRSVPYVRLMNDDVDYCVPRMPAVVQYLSDVFVIWTA